MVQGVRPIDEAVAAGWVVAEWLVSDRHDLSEWARDHLKSTSADLYRVSPKLMAELGEKDSSEPELLAVVEMPADDLDRLPVNHEFLGVAFDRPSSPGNVGTIARSLDALGGSGLIVTGHAADPYDPRTVRSSTGSIFRVPTVRSEISHVLAWADAVRDHGIPLQLVGTDESGTLDADQADLTRPTLLLTGNETRGLSRAWREMCDHLVRIPMAGHASSLNAASATSIMLYEATRQRRSRAQSD